MEDNPRRGQIVSLAIILVILLVVVYLGPARRQGDITRLAPPPPDSLTTLANSFNGLGYRLRYPESWFARGGDSNPESQVIGHQVVIVSPDCCLDDFGRVWVGDYLVLSIIPRTEETKSYWANPAAGREGQIERRLGQVKIGGWDWTKLRLRTRPNKETHRFYPPLPPRYRRSPIFFLYTKGEKVAVTLEYQGTINPKTVEAIVASLSLEKED